MLTYRLLGAAAAATRPSLAILFPRSFSTRVPSIGDINPSRECVEDFNAKQKAFREKLAAELEKREKEEVAQMKQAAAAAAAAATATTSKAASTATVSSTDTDPAAVGPQGLGSLSTALNEPHVRKPGIMSSLIYGTKEGREHDAMMEASFSAKIARGKYVHSIVYHQVPYQHVDEYAALIGEWYPKMAASKELNVHLVGSWRSEIGDCDTFGECTASPIHPSIHRVL